MLSERTTAPPLQKVLESQRAPRATLAIGPEGGWIDAEFAAANSGGFLETSLGRLLLRPETPLVAPLAPLNYSPDREQSHLAPAVIFPAFLTRAPNPRPPTPLSPH